MPRIKLGLATVALLGACSTLGPDGNAGSGPLRLTASIGREVLATGDTTSLVFELRNVSGESVKVNAGGCFILPFIQDRPSATIVYPVSGQWVCTADFRELTLAPGEAARRTLLVRGRTDESPPGAGAELPVGEYAAYGVLSPQPGVTLRSALVTFSIR
jgi:hypothetical protein